MMSINDLFTSTKSPFSSSGLVPELLVQLLIHLKPNDIVNLISIPELIYIKDCVQNQLTFAKVQSLVSDLTNCEILTMFRQDSQLRWNKHFMVVFYARGMSLIWLVEFLRCSNAPFAESMLELQSGSNFKFENEQGLTVSIVYNARTEINVYLRAEKKIPIFLSKPKYVDDLIEVYESIKGVTVSRQRFRASISQTPTYLLSYLMEDPKPPRMFLLGTTDVYLAGLKINKMCQRYVSFLHGNRNNPEPVFMRFHNCYTSRRFVGKLVLTSSVSEETTTHDFYSMELADLEIPREVTLMEISVDNFAQEDFNILNYKVLNMSAYTVSCFELYNNTKIPVTVSRKNPGPEGPFITCNAKIVLDKDKSKTVLHKSGRNFYRRPPPGVYCERYSRVRFGERLKDLMMG